MAEWETIVFHKRSIEGRNIEKPVSQERRLPLIRYGFLDFTIDVPATWTLAEYSNCSDYQFARYERMDKRGTTAIMLEYTTLNHVQKQWKAADLSEQRVRGRRVFSSDFLGEKRTGDRYWVRFKGITCDVRRWEIPWGKGILVVTALAEQGRPGLSRAGIDVLETTKPVAGARSISKSPTSK